MSILSLAKLLKQKSRLRSILDGLIEPDDGVCIQDPDGILLYGSIPPLVSERFPVFQNESVMGWVSGGKNPDALANLLAYAAEQESEKKTLAAELVERYRELNRLYHLSENLSSSPFPDAIARSALEEATHMISANAGMVLLKGEENDPLQKIAEWGTSYQLVPQAPVIDLALVTGRAGLANAVPGDAYFYETQGKDISILCAPLKTEKSMLGVILLIDTSERFFSAGELKLLNTIAQQTAPAVEIARLYLIELEKMQIEREFQMAREVQESLLPPQLPQIEGWKFNRLWRPAHNVSGDFYDVIHEGPHQLGLVIADITDKGLPASLFMVFVRSVLRASITRGGTPAEAITHANQVVCQDSYQGLFSTLFYARLETDCGKITYVNAGHPSPLLYRSAQDEVQMLQRTGMPLGVEVDTTFYDQTAQLDPGDFILFYTDGVTEAINSAEKEFGLERLKTEVHHLCHLTTEEILAGLEKVLTEFIAPQPVSDDVTMMIVKRV